MIIKEITGRRSIRSYKPDPVSDDAIIEIIKAAEFAPSGRHIRPIEYIIVKDKTIKKKLFDIFGDNFINEAPALIIPISDTGKSPLSMQDLSIASGYMFLQAKSLGLGTVWKNINEEKKGEVKQLLAIPAGYTMINMIPVGYPAENPPEHADDEFDAGKIHLEKF